MSYYHWLGRDTYEVEALVEHHNMLRRRQQESRDYMASIFGAYGYEEPQARTEGNNLTDSNSSNGSGESAVVDERDFPIVLHTFPRL